MLKRSLMFQELYSKAGIGVPFEDMETNDVVIFGVMVAEFLADFRHSPTRLPFAFFNSEPYEPFFTSV
jgi:hypothetical protein